MNLLELLNNELKDKHYTEIEKIRYIYLRCCQIFSFDSKDHFTHIFGDEELKNKMENKVFDIENIDDYLVVCHTFSKGILKPTLCEFTNIDYDLIGDNHTSVTFDHDNHKWELDATFGDLSRVKCKLKTNGFACDDRHWDKVIDEMDEEIGYIRYTKDYYNKKIKDDLLVDKIKSVNRLIINSPCKYHYSDAGFLYSILRSMYLYNKEYKDQTYIDRDYNFNKLINLDGENYYNLKRKRTIYTINKIDKKEYEDLQKKLVKAK